jgi:hypothetical protein
VSQFEQQIRKGLAPRADDVLNDAAHIGIRNAEIGKLLGKELVDLFDFSVIPKLLKVALDAILVGTFLHG